MNGFQQNIIARALTNSEELSDWENNFIETIDSHDADEYELTGKQNAILNRISDTLCRKGA